MSRENSGDGAEDDPDEAAGAERAGQDHQIVEPGRRSCITSPDRRVEVMRYRFPRACVSDELALCFHPGVSHDYRQLPAPRLLIVDDSPVALAFLEAIFRGAYFEVETAGNGVEGLDKALRNLPDLVVTDGLMPDVDGFELIRRLKSPSRLRHPGRHADVRRFHATSRYTSRYPQPDAFVAKSMQIEPLMNQVKALLAKPGSLGDT